MIMTLQDITNLSIIGFLIGIISGRWIENAKKRIEKKKEEKEAQLRQIYGQPPIQYPVYDIEYPETIKVDNRRKGMTNNLDVGKVINKQYQSSDIGKDIYNAQLKAVILDDNKSCNQRITELKKMIK